MRGYVSLHQKEDTSGCSREASWESHDEKSQPPIVLRVINAQAFDAFAPACHPERSEGSGSRGCMPRWNVPLRSIRDYIGLPNAGDHSLLLGKAYLQVTPRLALFASYFVLGHPQTVDALG